MQFARQYTDLYKMGSPNTFVIHCAKVWLVIRWAVLACDHNGGFVDQTMVCPCGAKRFHRW